MKGSAKQIAVVGLFCALSVLGAQIHIFGSVALDALPAFLAAFLLGGVPAAIVGAVGHLLTALFSGFPLTLPLHLVIAVEMAALCFVTGLVAAKRPLLLAAIVGFVLNALVSPLILLVWPGMGLAVCLALLPVLALGSAVNAFGAALLAALLKNRVPGIAKWRS
ncbi:MAG: ECF transporter S component [Bacillota bacterium]